MKKEFINNKIYLIAFIWLIGLSLVNVVSATSCSPTIQLVSQDPSPAVPDDYTNVLFQVSNLGGCSGFAVNFAPDQYPFSLDSSTSPLQTINAVPFAAGSPDQTWTIPYKVRVDKDALDGDYALKLQYHEGVSGNFQVLGYAEEDFNVSIQDSRTSFDSVVQQISGNSVSIAIANTGKYAANAVVVRVPTQDSFVVSGTAGQMVGNLASGDYTLVGFTVSPRTSLPGNYTRGMARNQTQAGNYSAPISPSLLINIAYTDNLGIRRDVNMSLPLQIGNATGVTGFSRTGTGGARTAVVVTHWYSSWITWLIVIIVLGAIYFFYKEHPEKFENLKNLFHKGKSSKKKSDDDTPDWIKNSKEKEKKK